MDKVNLINNNKTLYERICSIKEEILNTVLPTIPDDKKSLVANVDALISVFTTKTAADIGIPEADFNTTKEKIEKLVELNTFITRADKNPEDIYVFEGLKINKPGDDKKTSFVMTKEDAIALAKDKDKLEYYKTEFGFEVPLEFHLLRELDKDVEIPGLGVKYPEPRKLNQSVEQYEAYLKTHYEPSPVVAEHFTIEPDYSYRKPYAHERIERTVATDGSETFTVTDTATSDYYIEKQTKVELTAHNTRFKKRISQLYEKLYKEATLTIPDSKKPKNDADFFNAFISGRPEDVDKPVDEFNEIKKQLSELMYLDTLISRKSQDPKDVYVFEGLKIKMEDKDALAPFALNKTDAIALANDKDRLAYYKEKFGIEFPLDFHALRESGKEVPGIGVNYPEPRRLAQTTEIYEEYLKNHYSAAPSADNQYTPDDENNYRKAYAHERIKIVVADDGTETFELTDEPTSEYFLTERKRKNLEANIFSEDEPNLTEGEQERVEGFGRKIGDFILNTKNIFKSGTFRQKLKTTLLVGGASIGGLLYLVNFPWAALAVGTFSGVMLGYKHIIKPKVFKPIKKKIHEWLYGPVLETTPQSENTPEVTEDPLEVSEEPTVHIPTEEEQKEAYIQKCSNAIARIQNMINKINILHDKALNAPTDEEKNMAQAELDTILNGKTMTEKITELENDRTAWLNAMVSLPVRTIEEAENIRLSR